MGHRKWRDVEISAYLDGALTTQVQHALEEDLARDPELRQRVAAMRQVVTLVRTVPLHEPRRNYLLSPQPGKDQLRPQRGRMWRAALAFRALAALMALAFIASVGWQILPRVTSFHRGLMPAAAPPIEAPAPGLEVEESTVKTTAQEAESDTTREEVAKQVEAPVEQVQEMDSSVKAAPATEESINRADVERGGSITVAQTPPSATPAAATAVEEALGATPAAQASPTTSLPAEGIPGGGEMTVVQASPPPTLAPATTAGKAPAATPTTQGTSITETGTGVWNTPEGSPIEQAPPLLSYPAPGAREEAESPAAEPPAKSGKVWVSLGLGIATVASALLAYWFSRRGS